MNIRKLITCCLTLAATFLLMTAAQADCGYRWEYQGSDASTDMI